MTKRHPKTITVSVYTWDDCEGREHAFASLDLPWGAMEIPADKLPGMMYEAGTDDPAQIWIRLTELPW